MAKPRIVRRKARHQSGGSPLVLLILVAVPAAYWASAKEQKAYDVQKTHYEHNYSPSQVKAMESLVNTVASGEPDGIPSKLQLVHPKTKQERAQIIASIWGLQDGNYEIGRLK